MPPRRSWGNRALIPALSLALLIAVSAPGAATAADKPKLGCTIEGNKRANELRGTPERDVICGGGGNDRLIGGAGRDILYGDGGNDELDGGPGGDAIYGDVGKDDLLGGPGVDHEVGGPGRDTGDPSEKNGTPDCPSTSEYCEISLHLDIGMPCPGYRHSLGACWGRTPYANQCWDAYVVSLPGLFAEFDWFSGGSSRRVTYKAVNFGPLAMLEGSVPNSSSAAFAVRNAYCLKWSNPNFNWQTLDRPGVNPGKKGGPLYLNFRDGIIGADVYIDGYLSRR